MSLGDDAFSQPTSVGPRDGYRQDDSSEAYKPRVPRAVDGHVITAVRFAGHGSSFFTELVGMEGALWVTRRLRAVSAPGALLRCICDSLSAVTAVEGAQRRRGAARGKHRSRVVRCAMLATAAGVQPVSFLFVW